MIRGSDEIKRKTFHLIFGNKYAQSNTLLKIFQGESNIFGLTTLQSIPTLRVIYFRSTRVGRKYKYTVSNLLVIFSMMAEITQCTSFQPIPILPLIIDCLFCKNGIGEWHPFRVVVGQAYRGLTGGFLLLRIFSVGISVSPHVCFFLDLILISMFLR